MANITSDLKGQPLNKQDATSNETSNSAVSVQVDHLTINVFFDGTGNNMHNTDLRLKENPSEEEKVLQQSLKDEVSYENYYSNVAILQMACADTSTVKKVYVMGSGTFKHEKDSVKFGLGLSWGNGGVVARVTQCFKQIDKLVNLYHPDKITFNIFGFSRGAFFARYFCAMAKVTEEEIQKENELFEVETKTNSSDGVTVFNFYPIIESGREFLKFKNKDIRINLVGLYDTVSSEGLNHYNDVKPFHLNIGKKQDIAKIIHLTAQNEYRYHFPLTRVNTAVNDGIAFECSFPGAHSDIGGSYNKSYKESDENSEHYISILEKEEHLLNGKSGEIHWSWFEEMGYYKLETPLTAEVGYNGDFKLKKVSHFKVKILGDYYKVYSIRELNSNRYQFILLKIMKNMAEKFANLAFDDGGGKTTLDKNIAFIQEYPVLTKFSQYAEDYVNTHCMKSGLNFAVKAPHVLSKEEEKEMYHEHIHNSLKPGTIANGSGSGNGNKGPFNPERIIINDD